MGKEDKEAPPTPFFHKKGAPSDNRRGQASLRGGQDLPKNGLPDQAKRDGERAGSSKGRHAKERPSPREGGGGGRGKRHDKDAGGERDASGEKDTGEKDTGYSRKGGNCSPPPPYSRHAGLASEAMHTRRRQRRRRIALAAAAVLAAILVTAIAIACPSPGPIEEAPQAEAPRPILLIQSNSERSPLPPALGAPLKGAASSPVVLNDNRKSVVYNDHRMLHPAGSHRGQSSVAGQAEQCGLQAGGGDRADQRISGPSDGRQAERAPASGCANEAALPIFPGTLGLFPHIPDTFKRRNVMAGYRFPDVIDMSTVVINGAIDVSLETMHFASAAILAASALPEDLIAELDCSPTTPLTIVFVKAVYASFRANGEDVHLGGALLFVYHFEEKVRMHRRMTQQFVECAELHLRRKYDLGLKRTPSPDLPFGLPSASPIDRVLLSHFVEGRCYDFHDLSIDTPHTFAPTFARRMALHPHGGRMARAAAPGGKIDPLSVSSLVLQSWAATLMEVPVRVDFITGARSAGRRRAPLQPRTSPRGRRGGGREESEDDDDEIVGDRECSMNGVLFRGACYCKLPFGGRRCSEGQRVPYFDANGTPAVKVTSFEAGGLSTTCNDFYNRTMHLLYDLLPYPKEHMWPLYTEDGAHEAIFDMAPETNLLALVGLRPMPNEAFSLFFEGHRMGLLHERFTFTPAERMIAGTSYYVVTEHFAVAHTFSARSTVALYGEDGHEPLIPAATDERYSQKEGPGTGDLGRIDSVACRAIFETYPSNPTPSGSRYDSLYTFHFPPYDIMYFDRMSHQFFIINLPPADSERFYKKRMAALQRAGRAGRFGCAAKRPQRASSRDRRAYSNMWSAT